MLHAESHSLSTWAPHSPFFHVVGSGVVKVGQTFAQTIFAFVSQELPSIAASLLFMWVLFRWRSHLAIGAPSHRYDVERCSGSPEKDIWVGEMPPEARQILDTFELPETFPFQASVPRGVLLTGPPGTGKTLFAKQLARNARCSFFTCCASEFDEVYVGVGASNVRKIFQEATDACTPSLFENITSWYTGVPVPTKKAIIFIDELDAIGTRSTYADGSPSPTNQTITQLLSSLSGMRSHPNILVVAASNHSDTVDSAILRSGRFDQFIHIGLPNENSRMALLRHYLPSLHSLTESELVHFVKQTHNFSAADMENMVNEAKRHCENALMAHWKALPETDRKTIQQQDAEKVTYSHLNTALNSVKRHKELENRKHQLIRPSGLYPH